jgi:small subunit ribosomal protein S21
LKNNNFKKPGNPQKDGLTVEVRGDDIAGAMRRFKKKVQEAGIIQEVRDRQEYVKPSVKRAKAKKAGRARWLKKQSKEAINQPRSY